MAEKPTLAHINAFCQAAGEKRDDAYLNVLLHKFGYDIIHTAHSPGGGSPLGYAANWGHADLAEFFISKGADVNRPAEDGFTPLMSAAWHTSNPKTVAVLLKHGADINAVGKDGLTARMVAIEQKQEAALALIDGAAAERAAAQGTSKPIKPLRKIKLKI